MFEKLYDSLKETPHAGQNPETVHSGEILRLRNHKTCQPCQEGGCAALTAEKDSFRIHALFHDSDIFNTAKVNNERTWTTGDVCEFFIQPAGQDDYFEFHVTPEGITLQLHLPPVSRMGSVPFEKQIFESGMTHRVQVRRKENYWYAVMCIPFAGMRITEKEAWGSRFAVCRYNYSHGQEKPEMSSTAYFPDTGFHNPSRWHRLVP